MEYRGIFHLFFQDHNPMQLGGHLATRDLGHFKRLSIAIWNDQWYDKAAIWTFSATIVDGTPRIVYPGIAGTNLSNGDCGSASPGEGCFTHSLALPGNISDPWLEDWVKPALNPIVQKVNGTGINIASRDPSTAWRTAAGEWRYMDAKADIYSSNDFEHFQWAGNMPNFGTGDCPDFYPLPRDCDGCEPATYQHGVDDKSLQHRPSHVRAGGFNGVYALGNYLDQEPGTTGAWRPLPQYDSFPIDPERELSSFCMSFLHQVSLTAKLHGQSQKATKW
jgi:beta-fructofuranosidase